MQEVGDFDIKYWGKDFSYSNAPKKGRSIKKKLAIIATFLLLLAFSPAIIFNLGKIKLNRPAEISSTSGAKISPTQAPTPTAKPTPVSNLGTVINNDSYWKISKRYCGTGIYYLNIQQVNNSKALFAGDTVTISCQ